MHSGFQFLHFLEKLINLLYWNYVIVLGSNKSSKKMKILYKGKTLFYYLAQAISDLPDIFQIYPV